MHCRILLGLIGIIGQVRAWVHWLKIWMNYIKFTDYTDQVFYTGFIYSINAFALKIYAIFEWIHLCSSFERRLKSAMLRRPDTVSTMYRVRESSAHDDDHHHYIYPALYARSCPQGLSRPASQIWSKKASTVRYESKRRTVCVLFLAGT